jgi:hypothetical protein
MNIILCSVLFLVTLKRCGSWQRYEVYPPLLFTLSVFGLLTLANAPAARAQVTITTGGANNHLLESVTVNSTTYTSWINITVTSINAWILQGGADRGYIQLGNGTAQPAAADRMDLLQDNSLGTSIANIRELTVQFNAPVVNNPGTDILLFDYGAGDPFNLTINSTTNLIAATSFQSVLGNFTVDQYRADATLDTLAKWTDSANTFDFFQTITNQGISVLEVDLTNFGVAAGGSINTPSITRNGTTGVFDPAMILAIPEPGTWALLTGSLAAMMILRRRRRS